MKLLLADENFPHPSTLYLKEQGFDIVSVIENEAGIEDIEVIEWAIREDRIILTFDSDFGELIFKQKYRPPAGVIFFRWEHYQPDAPGKFLLNLLLDDSFLFGFTMTLIDEHTIRQRVY
ncbi:MAG: DUF5615 family PIN-like protein [Bacteroidia bacterium]